MMKTRHCSPISPEGKVQGPHTYHCRAATAGRISSALNWAKHSVSYAPKNFCKHVNLTEPSSFLRERTTTVSPKRLPKQKVNGTRRSFSVMSSGSYAHFNHSSS